MEIKNKYDSIINAALSKSRSLQQKFDRLEAGTSKSETLIIRLGFSGYYRHLYRSLLIDNLEYYTLTDYLPYLRVAILYLWK